MQLSCQENFISQIPIGIGIAGICAHILTVTYNAYLVVSELPVYKGPASES